MYDAARRLVGHEELGMIGEFNFLACFSMLVMLFRTFKQLDFQPRLALITRTLNAGNAKKIPIDSRINNNLKDMETCPRRKFALHKRVHFVMPTLNHRPCFLTPTPPSTTKDYFHTLQYTNNATAAWDLLHFCILMLLILLPYAFMGTLFYGSTKRLVCRCSWYPRTNQNKL